MRSAPRPERARRGRARASATLATGGNRGSPPYRWPSGLTPPWNSCPAGAGGSFGLASVCPATPNVRGYPGCHCVQVADARVEAAVGGAGCQRQPDSCAVAKLSHGHLAHQVCVSGPWMCVRMRIQGVQMSADPDCAITQGGLQTGMPFTGLSLAPSTKAVSGNQSQTPLSLRVQNHHELVCPVWKTGLVCPRSC